MHKIQIIRSVFLFSFTLAVNTIRCTCMALSRPVGGRQGEGGGQPLWGQRIRLERRHQWPQGPQQAFSKCNSMDVMESHHWFGGFRFIPLRRLVRMPQPAPCLWGLNHFGHGAGLGRGIEGREATWRREGNNGRANQATMLCARAL